MNRDSVIYKANFTRFNHTIEELRAAMNADHSPVYIDEFLNDAMTRYLEANGYTITAMTEPTVVEENVVE